MRPKGTQEPAADEAFAPLPPPSRKKKARRARAKFLPSPEEALEQNLRFIVASAAFEFKRRASGRGGPNPHVIFTGGLGGGQSWRRINRARNVKVAGRVRAEWVIWYFNVGTLNGFLFADEFSFGWMEYVLEYDLRLSLLQKHTHTNFVHL